MSFRCWLCLHTEIVPCCSPAYKRVIGRGALCMRATNLSQLAAHIMWQMQFALHANPQTRIIYPVVRQASPVWLLPQLCPSPSNLPTCVARALPLAFQRELGLSRPDCVSNEDRSWGPRRWMCRRITHSLMHYYYVVTGSSNSSTKQTATPFTPFSPQATQNQKPKKVIQEAEKGRKKRAVTYSKQILRL